MHEGDTVFDYYNILQHYLCSKEEPSPYWCLRCMQWHAQNERNLARALGGNFKVPHHWTRKWYIQKEFS